MDSKSQGESSKEEIKIIWKIAADKQKQTNF